MTMLHFKEAEEIVFSVVTSFAKDSSAMYYIIRDVYGRFSIYIENCKKVTVKKISDQLCCFTEWINRIQPIEPGDFFYETILNEAKKGVLINKLNNVRFSETYQSNSYWSGNIKFDKSNSNNKSKIVSYYSFKGGVGRTTLMLLSAINLVHKGKRIVVIDFDLEAPGVSSLLFDEVSSRYGVIDFLIEASLYRNNIDALSIDNYIYPVKNQNVLGSNGGELLIVPAFGSEGQENSKLMRLDLNAPIYYEKETPIDLLLSKINSSFDPDFILIDSRSGIHQVGGITLSRYTDLAILCFFGNKQNIEGMKVVVPAVEKQMKKFILVNVQKPFQSDLAERETDYFVNGSYEAMKIARPEYQSHFDIDDEEADHYPLDFPYMPEAILIDSTRQLLDLYVKSETYTNKIVESIIGVYSQTDHIINADENSKTEVLDALTGLIPHDNATPAAEDEFKSENDLRNKFYPLRSYSYIFEPRKFLVLGTKGAGKTALFTVLKYPSYAKSLARYIGIDTKNYENTTWIIGLAENDKHVPTPTIFDVVSNLNDQCIRGFWYITMLKKILQDEPSLVREILPENLISLINMQYSEIIVHLENDKMISLKIEEYFCKLDEECKRIDRKIVLVFDALDKQIPMTAWSRIISSLISIWYSLVHRVQNIQSKIFLRTDIYNSYIDMTDKVKLNNYSSDVSWTYDQLFALVWKRMSSDSPAFIALTSQNLDNSIKPFDESAGIGVIPNVDLRINKSILSWLVGDNMGSGNKAYTYNWFRSRLADTKDVIVPRCMIDIFSEAARLQKRAEAANRNQSKGTILKPKSLEDALPTVSIRRVTDLMNEYDKEYGDILKELRTLGRTPIDEVDLIDKIRSTRKGDAKETIDALCSIGVMRPYKKRKVDDPIRYHIPDIYLHGLGLRRFGTR